MACLKRPPTVAPRGPVLSTQPLSPASSRLDLAEARVLMRGRHLLPALQCLRLARPGGPCPGGTEEVRSWLRACGGCRCRWGGSLGCGCLSSADSRVNPTQGTRSEPIPLWCPAPPWSPQGSFSWACPVRRGPRQALPTPALQWTCPGAATDLPRSLFPGPGLGLSPATITTSSGLSALAWPSAGPEGRLPGCSSPGEAGEAGAEGRELGRALSH